MSEKTYELAGIRLTTELIGLKPNTWHAMPICWFTASVPLRITCG